MVRRLPQVRSNVFPIEMSELETRTRLHTFATLLSKTDVRSEISYSICEGQPLHRARLWGSRAAYSSWIPTVRIHIKWRDGVVSFLNLSGYAQARPIDLAK